MTAPRDDFDIRLRFWLVADAPSAEPAALHGAVVGLAAWLANDLHGW